MNENTNPVGNPRVGEATVRDASPEFERFEDLTRKLTQVPKSEVDEKRAAKPSPSAPSR